MCNASPHTYPFTSPSLHGSYLGEERKKEIRTIKEEERKKGTRRERGKVHIYGERNTKREKETEKKTRKFRREERKKEIRSIKEEERNKGT